MSLESDQERERLNTRIDNMFSRGTLHNTTPAGTQTAKIGMMADETNDGVEYPQDFGFISRAPGGSEVIVHHFGGERDHASILKAFHKRYTPKTLQEGECALFDKSGSLAILKADGSITLIPSGGTVHITGNLVVSGDISDKNGSMQEMRDDYNIHTHGSTPTPLPQMT